MIQETAYYFNLNGLENLSQNIAYKLIENEILMKLLLYGETDALSLPPVTDVDENILGKIMDQINTANTRIYFTPSPKRTQEEERSEIRLFLYRSKPENNVLSNLMVLFQVVCHDKLWALNDGMVRPYMIIKELLNTLNGKEVDGIGLLSTVDYPIELKTYSDWHHGYTLMFSTKTT